MFLKKKVPNLDFSGSRKTRLLLGLGTTFKTWNEVPYLYWLIDWMPQEEIVHFLLKEIPTARFGLLSPSKRWLLPCQAPIPFANGNETWRKRQYSFYNASLQRRPQNQIAIGRPPIWGPIIGSNPRLSLRFWGAISLKHCSQKGPYYRDRVPIGTFLTFWVPIGSLFIFQGPYFQCFGKFTQRMSIQSACTQKLVNLICAIICSWKWSPYL